MGYGVAAFGVGPLREIGGFAYSTAFSAGSLVAFMLAIAALLVIRNPAHAKTRGLSRRPDKSD